MLGAVTPDSFDTLHSYTNTFQMPFVTPWFPEKASTLFISFVLLHVNNVMIRPAVTRRSEVNPYKRLILFCYL